MDGAARAQAVRAAAQDRGIAGLQAERAGVRGHVRPALIDDADDAERHAHALDGHAVRPRPGCGDGADRVLERAHHLDAAAIASTRLASSVSRSRKAPVMPAARASAISSALAARMRADCARTAAAMAVERAVLLRRRGERQHAGGGARRLADFGHERGDIACPFNTFQRRAHRGKARQNPSLGVVPTTSDGSPARCARIVGIAWITAETREPIN